MGNAAILPSWRPWPPRGWAQAVALYRRAPAVRGAQASGWFELLARGPADLLPSAGEIEAVATGELPRELSLGRLVFVSHEESGATALALGGILCSEDQLDSIEGLFEVLAALRGSQVTGTRPARSLRGSPAPQAKGRRLKPD